MNGPPQKPTTACSGASSRRTIRDRLEQRRERLLRARAPAAARRRRASARARRRPARRLRRGRRRAPSEHRGHDVGEHHRRVDAVPAHGLQRHLGTELRRVGDLPERVPLADRAVLGQRPPRLSHEPDGRALDRLAPGGAHEERFHRGSRLATRVARGHSPSASAPARRSPLRPARSEQVPLEVENAGLAAVAARALRLAITGSTTGTTRSSGTASALPPRRSLPASARPSTAAVRAPIPPGRYRLAFDLVAELRAWFSELGSPMLAQDVDVAAARRRAERGASAGGVETARRTGRSASGRRTPRATRSSPARRLAVGRAPAPRRRELAAVRAGPGPRPRLLAPAPRPSVLTGRRARAARRARRPAGLRRPAGRAVGLRRPHRAAPQAVARPGRV